MLLQQRDGIVIIGQRRSQTQQILCRAISLSGLFIHLPILHREAVKVVAAEAIRETQEQDLMVLEKGRQQVMSPETKMKQKDRELVADWFVRAANTLKKRAKSILEKVIDALHLPATRDAVKTKIKEQARPSIIELLQNYKQKSQELLAQKPRQHSWEER